MFALTVSNGNARLLGLIVCASFACGSATWILGRDGESCLHACSNISQVCTEAELMMHNANVSGESEMRNLVQSNLGNCTKYNAKYGSSADVPVYQASSGECYLSAPDRDIGSFKCDRAPPVGKQRLCWCHNVSSQEENAKTVLNDDSEDWISSMSGQVVVVLISSVMLCLGLVGFAFGIMRRLRKRSLGIPETVKERPKDSGFYIRCPNCGCPVGESRSLKSWARSDGDASEKSTRTKSTRTSPSAKSNRTDSPCYTHCPACGCALGFPLTFTNLAEVSPESPKYNVTVSRAFRPGGSFLDLEEGKSNCSMGKLKMGDVPSPSNDATKTPRSALRKSSLRKPMEPAHVESAPAESNTSCNLSVI